MYIKLPSVIDFQVFQLSDVYSYATRNLGKSLHGIRKFGVSLLVSRSHYKIIQNGFKSMLENNFLSIKIIPQISHPEEEKGKKCPIIWVMSTWKIVSWKTEDFRERVKKPKVYPTDQKASLVTFQKRQQEMKQSYLSEMQRP